MEAGKISGDPCLDTDLAPVYIKTYPVNNPVTGVYIPNVIGTNPTFLGKDQHQWSSDNAGL